MRLLLVIIILFLKISCAASQDKKYTLVFLNKNAEAEKIDKEKSDKIMEGHMANINRLASVGKILAAGPFEGGGGIFVLNTTSVDEATQWLSTDPGVVAHRWNIEMFSYQPLVGSICSVAEPYEMVHYTFCRFDAVVSKSTASTFPQIIKKHDAFIKAIVRTGNVVTEGIFGENDGGIVVMKGEVDNTVFESDPGVQEGLLEVTIKKLFIAKGSFCEK
jgi:uncharacterized protein YciI